MKKGFTLIELLVVVVIIAILAAIALPQYQKAVRKARLTQAAVIFDTLSKSMDLYILENGYPAEGNRVWFAGEYGLNDKPILTFPWKSCSGANCDMFEDGSYWAAHCGSEGCNIYLWHSPLFSPQNPETNLHFKRTPDSSSWVFPKSTYIYPNNGLCTWVKDTYGTQKMDTAFKTACAALGVQ